MSTQELETAIDNKILATWEQERPADVLHSYIGSLAMRAGLAEYDSDLEEDIAA